MLAYPTEDQKGIFIGIFWSIFNLGGVVGAAVSFGNNFDNTVRPTPSCVSRRRPLNRSIRIADQLWLARRFAVVCLF